MAGTVLRKATKANMQRTGFQADRRIINVINTIRRGRSVADKNSVQYY